MMLLFILLMCVISSDAGVILNEIPLTTTLTNIHSPTAYSHQTITQIHTNERKVLLKPSSLSLLKKTSLHQGFYKESESLENIEYPYAQSSVDSEDSTVRPEVEHDNSSEYESSSSYIIYKENTPVFTSQTHTPAHLTYAASPIVYKMLPLVKKGPYKSYTEYLTSLRYKNYV